MPEYISREAALDSLCTACESVPIDEKELCPYRFTGCQEYANLLTLRTADVKPVVRGKWMPHKTKTGKNWWKCSACDYVSEHKRNYNYCPNCGADMRKPEAKQEPAPETYDLLHEEGGWNLQ